MKRVIPHALRHAVLLRRCGTAFRKKRLLVTRSRVCAAAFYAAARTGWQVPFNKASFNKAP